MGTQGLGMQMASFVLEDFGFTYFENWALDNSRFDTGFEGLEFGDLEMDHFSPLCSVMKLPAKGSREMQEFHFHGWGGE